MDSEDAKIGRKLMNLNGDKDFSKRVNAHLAFTGETIFKFCRDVSAMNWEQSRVGVRGDARRREQWFGFGGTCREGPILKSLDESVIDVMFANPKPHVLVGQLDSQDAVFQRHPRRPDFLPVA